MNPLDTIKELGFIPHDLRITYFADMDFPDIRNWLEVNGLPRTMCIESESTEIAILTPEGIILQIRPEDNEQLGLFGGCVNAGESKLECAIRELREETGLYVSPDKLIFVEIDEHEHTYSNGNKGRFRANRYLLQFDYVPEITINEESSGYLIVNSATNLKSIVKHQRNFISRFI